MALMVNLQLPLPAKLPPLKVKDFLSGAGVIAPPHVPTSGSAGNASSILIGSVSVKEMLVNGDESGLNKEIVIVDATSPVTRIGSNFLLIRNSGVPTVTLSLAAYQFWVVVVPLMIPVTSPIPIVFV